jgi:hypothetical protein
MMHQVQTIDGTPHDYFLASINGNVAIVTSIAGMGFHSPFLIINGEKYVKLISDNKTANFLRKDKS